MFVMIYLGTGRLICYSVKNSPKCATWVIIYIALLQNVYRIYDITFNGNMSLKALYTANIFTKMIPSYGESSRPHLGSLEVKSPSYPWYITGHDRLGFLLKFNIVQVDYIMLLIDVPKRVYLLLLCYLLNSGKYTPSV